MWQAQIGERTWSNASPGGFRAGRWALLAAAVVVALPVLALMLAAVLVGGLVFVLVVASSIIAGALRRLVNQVRGQDDDGRQNVRVIQRDP